MKLDLLGLQLDKPAILDHPLAKLSLGIHLQTSVNFFFFQRLTIFIRSILKGDVSLPSHGNRTFTTILYHYTNFVLGTKFI